MKRNDDSRHPRDRIERWALGVAVMLVVILSASDLRAETPGLDDRLLRVVPAGFDDTAWTDAVPTTFEARPLSVRATPLRRAPGVAANRFYREHFIPRLSRQLASAIPVVPSAGTTAEMGQHAMFEDYRELTEHLAEKGARRAVKHYLIGMTSIDGWIAGKKERRRGHGGREGGLRFRLRVSHAVPRAELDYRAGSTALNLGLSTEGALSLEFRHLDRSDTRVVAGYDLDTGEYALQCRIIF